MLKCEKVLPRSEDNLVHLTPINGGSTHGVNDLYMYADNEKHVFEEGKRYQVQIQEFPGEVGIVTEIEK